MKKTFNYILLINWAWLISSLINAVSPFLPASIQTSFLTPYDMGPLWMLLFLSVMLVFIAEHKMYKKTWLQGVFRTIALVSLLPGVFFACTFLYRGFSSFKYISGCVMLCLFAALLVLFHKAYNKLLLKKVTAVWEATSLITAMIGVSLWVPNMWGIRLPQITLNGDLLDYYIGLLSLTFITISVMSMLSDKSVIIYWENVAEAKLIKPLFGSFVAYTAYSISATVGAGISVLLGNSLAFAVFLVINVLILIFLTLTMVDVYYGREQKRRGLAQKLRIATGMRKMPEFFFSDDLAFYKSMDYRDMMQNLHHYLYHEIEERNIPYIREVAELYGGYMNCFDTKEGEEVKKLLFSAPIELNQMVVDGIGARVSEMAQKHDSLNAYANQTWREDDPLWAKLAENETLEYLTADPSLTDKFAETVLDRVTLLFNDLLLSKGQSYEWRFHITKTFRRYHCRVNHRLFERLIPVYDPDNDLIPSLAHIILYLMKNGSDGTRRLIEKHPAVRAFGIHLKRLGFTDPEISLWYKYFGIDHQ